MRLLFPATRGQKCSYYICSVSDTLVTNLKTNLTNWFQKRWTKQPSFMHWFQGIQQSSPNLYSPCASQEYTSTSTLLSLYLVTLSFAQFFYPILTKSNNQAKHKLLLAEHIFSFESKIVLFHRYKKSLFTWKLNLSKLLPLCANFIYVLRSKLQ